MKAFGVDFFFDDQQKHCESARHHAPCRTDAGFPRIFAQ
ncbi:MAG: hypothetical protein ACYCTW_05745 [Sulfuricella sp.]